MGSEWKLIYLRPCKTDDFSGAFSLVQTTQGDLTAWLEVKRFGAGGQDTFDASLRRRFNEIEVRQLGAKQRIDPCDDLRSRVERDTDSRLQ
ncbi:hypothetical protein D3C84_854570 [compost metagenome]